MHFRHAFLHSCIYAFLASLRVHCFSSIIVVIRVSLPVSYETSTSFFSPRLPSILIFFHLSSDTRIHSFCSRNFSAPCFKSLYFSSGFFHRCPRFNSVYNATLHPSVFINVFLMIAY